MRPVKRLSLTPSAVLLDWDDTLIDPSKTRALAVDATLAEMQARGWDLNANRHPPFSGETLVADAHSRIAIIETLMEACSMFSEKDQASSAVEHIYRGHIREFSKQHTHAMAGAAALIKQLQAKEIPFAIVSNKPSYMIEHEWEVLFRSLEKPLIVGRDHPAIQSENGPPLTKPNPLPLRIALNRLGVSDERHAKAWMVGDSLESDVAAAQALGCEAVWISRETIATEYGTQLPSLEVLRRALSGRSATDLPSH